MDQNSNKKSSASSSGATTSGLKSASASAREITNLRIVSWNVSKRNNYEGICAKLKEQNPHIVILQESTELHKWNPYVECSVNDHLMLLWDTRVVELVGPMHIISTGGNLFIWSMFEIVKSTTKFRVFGVYGDSTQGLDLEQPVKDKLLLEPWIMLGDWNPTRDYGTEKSFICPRVDKVQLSRYNSFLNEDKKEHEATEVVFPDVDDRLSTVDGIVYNSSFSDLFEYTRTSIVPTTLSDHMVLYVEMELKKENCL